MSKHSSPGSPTDTASMRMKKQKPKDSEEELTTADSDTGPIQEDFVLMSTPEKFRDKPEVDPEDVLKLQRLQSPLSEIKNLDCLLLADTSMECAPLHLQNILEHYNCSVLSQGEILFLLIYIVAIESGFVGQNDYSRVKNYITHLSSTATFHSKNVLRLSLMPPTYTKTCDHTRFSLKLYSLVDVEENYVEQKCATLTAFVTGDFCIVTLSPAPSTGARGFSIALSTGRYVLSMQMKNKPLYQRFRKLNELSVLLRDQLFGPMKNQHSFWLGATVYPSLEALPPELYDNILQYLNTNQLKILANVSKSLYNLTVSSKYMLTPQREQLIS